VRHSLVEGFLSRYQFLASFFSPRPFSSRLFPRFTPHNLSIGASSIFPPSAIARFFDPFSDRLLPPAPPFFLHFFLQCAICSEKRTFSLNGAPALDITMVSLYDVQITSFRKRFPSAFLFPVPAL